MASEMELKACPFCNSDDVMVLDVEPTGQMSEYSHVHCANCLANGPMKQSDKQAATAWSTRPVPAPVEVRDGQRFTIEHDGFTGTVIGSYERLDGYRGVVMQQDGCRVVHVYGEKHLRPALTSPQTSEAGE